MKREDEKSCKVAEEGHQRFTSVEHWLEPRLFKHRLVIMVAFLLASVLFAWQAALLKPDASFQKMVPATHPFIANYLKYENELRPLGNNIRIAVEATKGDIYSKEYLDTLKAVTDEVFYIPGVDRGNLKSLWTPNVQWMEVTETGLNSGQIIPQGFDGSPAMLDEVRANVARSGRIGSLVAADQKSTIVQVPLLEIDPDKGTKLDYGLFSERLEKLVRDKYEAQGVKIHIVGFAKVVGDLIHGAKAIGLFFAITFAMTVALLLWYSHCWKSTLVTVFCCSLAVIWQLGIVRLLGFGLDPYSILVPFLTFAIGVSHAVQNINTMASERLSGKSATEAAKQTFRQLFIPGTIALLCDAVGFSTLLVIEIGVIRELAISASVGVAVIVLTKMFLLPVLMSYVGVTDACLRNQARKAQRKHRFMRMLSRIAEPKYAKLAVLGAVAVFATAFALNRDLKIGDLDPGAPELRADSRYNRDNAYITAHYSLSSDQFAVMVKTPKEGCLKYETLVEADRLAWALRQVEGVQTTVSLADAVRLVTAGTSEGSPKWLTLSRNQDVLNYGVQQASVNNPELFDRDCSLMPVIAYLSDHKAATLERVTAAAAAFAAEHSTPDRQFLLAAGSAGIEAATNIVVKEANHQMLMYVYAAVIVLCWVTFRNWRAVLVAVLPLVLTSILCEALMVMLGMGVKVATLPVIALGVGIGVDYALYLVSVQLAQQRRGETLTDAYRHALQFTGKVVALVGVTLAAGVVCWAWSPIKFQADMGILLTFMFTLNMVGALVLVPALSHFLLRKVK